MSFPSFPGRNTPYVLFPFRLNILRNRRNTTYNGATIATTKTGIRKLKAVGVMPD